MLLFHVPSPDTSPSFNVITNKQLSSYRCHTMLKMKWNSYTMPIPSFFLFQHRALQYMFLINGSQSSYSEPKWHRFRNLGNLEWEKTFTAHGQCTVDHQVVQSFCLFSLLFVVWIEHNTCMKVSISSMSYDGTENSINNNQQAYTFILNDDAYYIHMMF